MKRLSALTALALAVVASAPLVAQSHRVVSNSFATDSATIPVVSNVTGREGATFQSYVSLFNPTNNSFAVNVSLYDATGTKRDASITLAAKEQKTYENFLADVFNYTGGGALTLSTADTAGGTRNNRFVVSSEIWTGTGGTRYGTSVPVLEFTGTDSPSFSGGISVDTKGRSNFGCFNQSDSANAVKATVYDKTGAQALATYTLNLPAHAWNQTAITVPVTEGFVKFEPEGSAVCYAVVVNNVTNDGRYTNAAEYLP